MSADRLKVPKSGGPLEWLAFIAQLVQIFPAVAEALRRIFSGHPDGESVRSLLSERSKSLDAAEAIRRRRVKSTKPSTGEDR